MTPFDELLTPSFLYTLKLILPLFPENFQRSFGILVKYMELRNVLEHFYGIPADESRNTMDNLKQYLSPEILEQMEELEGIMSMIEMMQDESTPMDFMKGMMNHE